VLWAFRAATRIPRRSPEHAGESFLRIARVERDVGGHRLQDPERSHHERNRSARWQSPTETPSRRPRERSLRTEFVRVCIQLTISQHSLRVTDSDSTRPPGRAILTSPPSTRSDTGSAIVRKAIRTSGPSEAKLGATRHAEIPHLIDGHPGGVAKNRGYTTTTSACTNNRILQSFAVLPLGNAQDTTIGTKATEKGPSLPTATSNFPASPTLVPAILLVRNAV